MVRVSTLAESFNHKISLILPFFLFFFKFPYFRIDMANEWNALEGCMNSLDQCNESSAKDAENDVISPAIDSKPHCLCALYFYACLQKIETFLSKQIGDLYFASNDRCYRNNFQTIECVEYDDEYLPSNRRCTQYLLDSTTAFQPQWFDLPHFSGKRPKLSLLSNLI